AATPTTLQQLTLPDALPFLRVWGSLGFLLTVLAAGAWFQAFGMGSFAAWTSFSLAAVALSTFLLPEARDPAAHHEKPVPIGPVLDRKSTRLNSSHVKISYAV